MWKKDAMKYLENELNLSSDSHCQDWDLELADGSRVEEFISYLKEKELNDDAKFALMSLILASFEDFLIDREQNDLELWREVENELKRNSRMYEILTKQWGLLEHQSSQNHDLYKIERLARE